MLEKDREEAKEQDICRARDENRNFEAIFADFGGVGF